VEPVFHLDRELAGIVEMGAAESVAVVLEIAGIAEIESGDGEGKLLAK
jgi:hypothetical protein